MNNHGEEDVWPPTLEAISSRQEAKGKIEADQADEKQPFDFIGKLLTYIIGFGLAAVLVVFFIRLVMWILGINL